MSYRWQQHLTGIILALSLLMISGCTDALIEEFTRDAKKEINESIDETKEEISQSISDTISEAFNGIKKSANDSIKEIKETFGNIIPKIPGKNEPEAEMPPIEKDEERKEKKIEVSDEERIEKAISWAEARLGDKGIYFMDCHTFVLDALKYGGIDTTDYKGSALVVYNSYANSVQKGIPPRGAIVLYDLPHTALSLGGGKVINNNSDKSKGTSEVKEEPYDAKYFGNYLGWLMISSE